MPAIGRAGGGTQPINRRDFRLEGVILLLVFNIAVGSVKGILALREGVSVLLDIPWVIVLRSNRSIAVVRHLKVRLEPQRLLDSFIGIGSFQLAWVCQRTSYPNDYDPQPDLAVPTATPSCSVEQRT